MNDKEYVYRTGAGNVSAVIFDMVGRGKRVLEVGCSVGTQTRVLVQELSCEVTGLEIDANAADKARKYAREVIVGSFESDDVLSRLSGRSFDVVLFADVLEHLYDPRQALVRARGLLAEGGELLASVPNIAHAAIVWELAHGRFNYQRFGLLDDTHIRFFTRRTLADLFESAGYRTLEWRRFDAPADDAGFPVVAAGERDAAFLQYVAENNNESQTYQFVVRAAATADQGDAALERRLNQMSEENDLLSRKLAQAESTAQRLQSSLDWIEESSLAQRLKTWLGKVASR